MGVVGYGAVLLVKTTAEIEVLRREVNEEGGSRLETIQRGPRSRLAPDACRTWRSRAERSPATSPVARAVEGGGTLHDDDREELAMHDNKPGLTALRAAITEAAARPLAQASTMPPAAYTSEELFEFETREIFVREWICVGRVEEIPRVGDYFTTRIAEEPLIVVRSTKNEIRVLSNVCRHKWTQIADGCGHTKRFVCPYHAWTYDLEGRLVVTRFMDEAEGFHPGTNGLSHVHSAVWRGFIYVNIDGQAPAIANWLTELDGHTGNYHMEEMRLICGGEEVWANNWKLLFENFTDTYHVPHTHQASIGQYSTADQENMDGAVSFALGISPIRSEYPAFEPHHADLTAAQRYAFSMIGIFPAHMIALAPNRVFYMCLSPVGVDHVRTKWGVAFYGPEPSPETVAEMDSLYRQVNAEDRVRLENIQHSLRSRFAAPGRLSRWEKMNLDFTRYMARRLSAHTDGP
jgi:phenylpropionate dioxygenase-like ring-hydroxylating dioxygenase large terminal subunit